MPNSEFQGFDPRGEFRSYQRHLPHWRQPVSTYLVTFRLGDSLPAAKLREWQDERETWMRVRGIEDEAGWQARPAEEHALFHEHFHARIQQWLDAGFGACTLRRPEAAGIVADALMHFDGDRYALDEFVVMPNHVHAIVSPSPEHDLAAVLQSWKGFSARRINQVLGRSGPLWQAESFDRIIRDEAELERWREYIRLNPETARLPAGTFAVGRGAGFSNPAVSQHQAGKPGATKSPAVFLDRDGTLMDDTGYVRDPAHVRIFDGVRESLAALKARGFRTVIVTNQSGIPRGYFTIADYEAVQARFLELIGPGLIDATYMCADHPDTASDRRKPGPGMLLEAARDLGIDLARSWMIGDRAGDLEAGHRAGTRAILVLTGEAKNAEGTSAEFVAKDFASAAEFILASSDA